MSKTDIPSRTESVAEKMLTNWLAFCMYDFLKVGNPDLKPFADPTDERNFNYSFDK